MIVKEMGSKAAFLFQSEPFSIFRMVAVLLIHFVRHLTLLHVPADDHQRLIQHLQIRSATPHLFVPKASSWVPLCLPVVVLVQLGWYCLLTHQIYLEVLVQL